MTAGVFLCRNNKFGELRVNTFFLNSGFLTSKSTQVVQFSTAYFTNLINCNAVDSRRFQREDTFYTYSS